MDKMKFETTDITLWNIVKEDVDDISKRVRVI